MTSPVPKPAVPPTDPNADVQGLGYEQARDELVAVVARLESGAGSLEEALALWERGEIKSLRADISSTREDLALAKRHTAMLEQQLEARLLSAEQRWSTAVSQAQGDEAAEKRDDHPAFHLTQDEVLLVRNYIKVSPSKAAASLSTPCRR